VAADDANPNPVAARSAAPATMLALPIVLALSVGHGLNDIMQSVLVAIYPLIKPAYNLSYAQIGLIGAVFSITASVLQPIIGLLTDRWPRPFSLTIGMACTMCGLLMLGFAPSYGLLLLAAAMIGTGSSIFHPDASRIARIASGGRYGLAQSMFQTGGNVGTSIGPLLAALIIVPNGQRSAAWFAAIALTGAALLGWVGTWYRDWLATHARAGAKKAVAAATGLTPAQVWASIAILVALMFSKFVYMTSLSSYYTFYLIEHFGMSVQAAQYCLFLFLAATAAGTMLGGPIGDRIGARRVILASILGVLPFTLLLPYADITWTILLTIPIGLILASAFSVMVVYAQSLVPGRVGLIGGLFFGLAFGSSGVAAAGLGALADHTGIEPVFRICAFLPAIGLLALLLPRMASEQTG
jgi:MFS transporter, FSR family, fosmidomycin resistance protein